MQEQMNSMSDSGCFQEVESNYSGRLSHVSNQPAMIPSSRSMLNRDKRLPLDTHGIHLDYRIFFGNQFSRFSHPEIIIKEFNLTMSKENLEQSHKLQGEGIFSQEMTNKIEAQFQCRHLQEGRRLWVLQYWSNFRWILCLNSKDSKYRKCNSTKS